MGIHVKLGEFVAVPQCAASFANVADVQAMFFRAQLIQALVIEQLTILALLGAMTMPQAMPEGAAFQTPFAAYNVSQEPGTSSQQTRTERVFQRTFYQPQESTKTEYTPPPAPKASAKTQYSPPPPAPQKILPPVSPETLAFLETKGVSAKNGDPYSFLGLTKEASLDDVKKAYRKLAVKLHPDKHKNDPQYVEPFRAIQEAYEMINPDKR